LHLRVDRALLASSGDGADLDLHAWVDRGFGPAIWPIPGIIFPPLTTLLYVILWNTRRLVRDRLGVDLRHPRLLR
jgi:hypothetical protein